ncbi:MAG TPA: hypothetical protein VHQ01_04550 [Pyrinomonadaceae bacterium]|nr:hypothetical protein [Pyrinomonadaceae bacterium]
MLSCLFILTCFIAAASNAQGQVVVDKTVAVVSDGVRTPELITYSDLLWQLALQPGTQLDKPRSEDLNQALQLLINQRLFTLEAERLPRTAPTQKEIADKINETLSHFPSPAVFEARLKQVGFDSVKDEAFEHLIAQRVATEKYIDFRFASFVVISADDEAKYYRDVFVPAFRQKSPGVLAPTFEEKQAEIHRTMTREKVAVGIERFLDEAKRRDVVEILIEV